MADYGFKYSKPEKNVVGEKVGKNLGYSSIFNTFKTHKKGNLSVSASANSLTSAAVAHGLGYRPAFNVYFQDTGNGEIYQAESGFEDVNFNRDGAEVNVHASSNNYNLLIDVYNNTANTKGVDVFYEIFFEDMDTEFPLYVG